MASSQPTPKRQPATKRQPASGKSLLQNIFFGGTAGVVGQSCVFPLYTVKTRLHLYPNRYRNVYHCARKIVQHEGMRGLYRGLPPALTGVFPEKAIKLSMNDYLSAVLARPDGTVSTPMAMIAGAGAGFSQVVATNPMELVMIRMQNNAASGRKQKSMIRLARELGLSGLYQGTQATLLRDVPFSMIFFSMNTQLRQHLTDEQGHLPMSRVFLAGIFSGSTAAALSTPMDVIKTRLQAASKEPAKRPPAVADTLQVDAQSVSRTGTRAMSTSAAASQIEYEGIVHCARHIYATEGIAGLFAGVVPRVLIISPLFGITLFFYDVQRRLKESGQI